MEEPPSGDVLLERLRGGGRARPLLDPEVDAHLHQALDEATADIGHVPPEVVVRVSKGRLREVLLCEASMVASLVGVVGAPSMELVAGLLLDRLFGLVVFGHPVTDPVAEALSASDVAGDGNLRDAFDALTAEERDEVVERVTTVGRTLGQRWPALPANALPRLQEPLRADLAGGRVVLSGRVDLALGRPTADRAGTTLVDVKSGRRRYDDALDADWYAVLEAMRHHAPPFQSGSYYVRDGVLDLAVYDEPRLVAATSRVADGVARMVRLAAGDAPEVTPNGLCPWCPALPTCEAGQAAAAEQGFAGEGWGDADDDP